MFILAVGAARHRGMETRGTLKKQLENVQLELQTLQIENRRLREELKGQPDQSRELELVQELVTVREENLSLTKELDQVTSLTGKNESELAEQLQQQINKQEQVVQ